MTKRQKIRLGVLAALVVAALVTAYLYGGGAGRRDGYDGAATEFDRNKSISGCLLSIRCDTLLDHLDTLDASVAELVPKDGVLLEPTDVAIKDGESVFDLLLRETKANDIQLEFSEAPLYGSAYIEGIGNLYEFDGGELSGWMYRVNGEFPNYGCSHYALHSGDTVEWVYTCDLGADVGNVYNAWQQD